MDEQIHILLRGHVRKSLHSPKLYNFIKSLSMTFKINLYIQTWCESEAKLSWRVLKDEIYKVSKEQIIEYFADLAPLIRFINICDDTKISIPGMVIGNVSKTSPMPILGWKRMLWCMLEGVNNVNNFVKTNNLVYNRSQNITLISTRFDLFDIPESGYIKLTNTNIKSWIIQKYYSATNITYLKPNEFHGVDNIFLAPIKKLLSFTQYLLYNLDIIRDEYANIPHQEFLFYRESNKQFDDLIISSPVT